MQIGRERMRLLSAFDAQYEIAFRKNLEPVVTAACAGSERFSEHG